MSRLSTLGCQTTVYCSGLPLLLAPRRLLKRSTFTGHQRIPISTVVWSLYTEWLARPRPRHDGVTLWHQAERHPQQARLRHTSAYSHTSPTRGDSYIPESSTSVSSQCRSQDQADTQVISSQVRYTFTPRPPLVAVSEAHRFQVSRACLSMIARYRSSLSL